MCFHTNFKIICHSSVKRHMHHNVPSSINNNCQAMEVTQMSINRWMDKDVVYTHNVILVSHKQEWNFAICQTMGGIGEYYAM